MLDMLINETLLSRAVVALERIAKTLELLGPAIPDYATLKPGGTYHEIGKGELEAEANEEERELLNMYAHLQNEIKRYQVAAEQAEKAKLEYENRYGFNKGKDYFGDGSSDKAGS